MKRSSILVILTLLALGLLFIIAKFLLNPPPRDIAQEAVAFSIPAEGLHDYFSENDKNEIGKYVDQVLKITGQISYMDGNNLILDERIMVQLDYPPNDQFKLGQQVAVKGRCVGYDELLSLVKIDQALIL